MHNLSSTPPVNLYTQGAEYEGAPEHYKWFSGFRTNEIHPPHHYLHVHSACHAQSNKLGKTTLCVYMYSVSHPDILAGRGGGGQSKVLGMFGGEGGHVCSNCFKSQGGHLGSGGGGKMPCPLIATLMVYGHATNAYREWSLRPYLLSASGAGK